VPLPFVKVIVFEDTDAVTILLPTNDAVDAKDELIEVVANELDRALVAKDAVPNRLPVTPCVTIRDPVIVVLPLKLLVPLTNKLNAVEEVANKFTYKRSPINEFDLLDII
jgi:hypothetical protein